MGFKRTCMKIDKIKAIIWHVIVSGLWSLDSHLNWHQRVAHESTMHYEMVSLAVGSKLDRISNKRESI